MGAARRVYQEDRNNAFWLLHTLAHSQYAFLYQYSVGAGYMKEMCCNLCVVTPKAGL